jgi:putative spermidine/putrescine transport system permease protein
MTGQFSRFPETWSWRWFAKALAYDDFVGFRNGLIVTSWLIHRLAGGTAFAFAPDRYSFRSSARSRPCFVLLVVPHFTIGLGFLILPDCVGWARGFVVVVACHVVLVLPFVLRSVYVSLRNLDPRLEIAAASLGASPARVLTTVTLPLLLPGLVGGWLLAAILSFNEFTASLFVTAQRTQTLPVAMYNYVREYADTSMAALSVMYIVATATLLPVANAYLGLGKVLNVEPRR